MTDALNTAWSIDWLSVTFKNGVSDLDLRKMVAFGFPLRSWTEVQARFGYSFAMIHPFGHTVMMNHSRQEMGVHLSFPGRALRACFDGGVPATSLLEWAVNGGAKITRLDLAIDLFDVPVDPVELAQKPRMDLEPGTARKWSTVAGHDGGATAYIGSRKSERFLRIYDKAREQRRDDIVWTRFELELKSDSARAAAKHMVLLSDDERPQYIKGLIKALFNPNDETFQEAMKGPASVLTTVKDTEDNTIDWLMNSVAKTMAKTMARRTDVDVWAMFIQAVHSNLQELGIDFTDV